MGSFRPGDVILASVSIGDRAGAKVRPAVVVETDKGTVVVCPVSSKAPSDAPAIPISLDDFAQGGLDLFGESFVMAGLRVPLRSGDILGKRGRLRPEPLAEIGAAGPGPVGRSPRKTGRPGYTQRGH
ncbi:MAG TPA: type II toxin-antitoxin system PemK/MazF family toxin [Methanoregula sp.]|nr:type II toxin-antitoxin system PemK/MazF family toxin [Methanoregula sp.]